MLPAINKNNLSRNKVRSQEKANRPGHIARGAVTFKRHIPGSVIKIIVTGSRRRKDCTGSHPINRNYGRQFQGCRTRKISQRFLGQEVRNATALVRSNSPVQDIDHLAKHLPLAIRRIL